jgi:hypothetical protein
MHTKFAPCTLSIRAQHHGPAPARPGAASVLVLAAGLVVLAAAPAALAQPIGDWYGTMSNFSGARQAHVIGGVFGISAAVTQAEAPIAVAGDVRTMGAWSTTGGALYNLAGTPQGPTYTHPASIPGFTFDGTTDGTWNYTVDTNTGNVYRLDRAWANPTYLFSAGRRSQGGIAYDCRTRTIWVANEGGCTPSGDCGVTGAMTNYTLGGTPLGSAVLANSGQMNDLAIDVDGTFWVHTTYAHGDELVHYNALGQGIGSFAINLGGDTIRGAEIGCTASPTELVNGCFPASTVLHPYARNPGNPWIPGEWNAENATITGAVSGVTPFEGGAMLRVNATGGSVSQVSQIVDVSAWASQIDAGAVVVRSSVQVNAAVATTAPQMFVLAGESQTAVGTLNPVGGPTIIEGFNRAFRGYTVDNIPASWETMNVSLVLPSGTRFLHFELLGVNTAIPPTGIFFDCATVELAVVPPCRADVNGDNQVDFFDYLDFASAFDAEDPAADFNGDTQVDFFDYLDFASAFDAGCE